MFFLYLRWKALQKSCLKFSDIHNHVAKNPASGSSSEDWIIASQEFQDSNLPENMHLIFWRPFQNSLSRNPPVRSQPSNWLKLNRWKTFKPNGCQLIGIRWRLIWCSRELIISWMKSLRCSSWNTKRIYPTSHYECDPEPLEWCQDTRFGFLKSFISRERQI